MAYFNSDDSLEILIRNVVAENLNLTADWVGNSETPTFGVLLNLRWGDQIISSTVVNFIEK